MESDFSQFTVFTPILNVFGKTIQRIYKILGSKIVYLEKVKTFPADDDIYKTHIFWFNLEKGYLKKILFGGRTMQDTKN